MESPDLANVLIALIGIIPVIWAGAKAKQALKGGKTALPSATPQDVIEVAGSIVSDKAVDKMVKSLDAFTGAAVVLTASIDKDVEAKTKLTGALDRNSEVCAKMHEDIKDIGDSMDNLKVELIRSQGYGKTIPPFGA